MPEVNDVFVYGSLMHPQVWTRVVRGRYAGGPATLAGWRRHALREAAYPGAVPSPGSRIEGWLWRGVDEEDLSRLDAFEGEEYRRDTVEVVTADGPARAQVYAFLDPSRLEPRDWDGDAFARDHADTFADAHARPARPR